MSPTSKKEYFLSAQQRYLQSSGKKKSLILDELCATLNHHRKYAIRKLNNLRPLISAKQERRGRPLVYGDPQLRKVLEKIWLTAHRPCSKRLKSMLPSWTWSYQTHYGNIPQKVFSMLYEGGISHDTLDRILKPIRSRYKVKGLCTTRPGSKLFRRNIPVKLDQWNEKKPGFLEADTVSHCGESAQGTFVSTLDCVDIVTGWSEQRAVWRKEDIQIREQLRDIEERLPFALLGFDSDNGMEFMNALVYLHFTQRKKPIQFTRSRPYHKDDNAHVEQKNWTHVRKWLGYARFDNYQITGLLNDLYRGEWRYFHNFFMPSVKLIEKKRVGSKIVKVHDRALTPYQRILKSPYIHPDTKASLKKVYEGLNPFELRKIIDRKIAQITKLAG